MPKPPKTVLGFDFGMRRIGVAIGQTVTRSANPLTTLSARDGIPDWEEITQLVHDWHAEALVVGIPYNMDGSTQHTTFAAKKFANRLHAKTKLPVHTIDERLTTIEAKRMQRGEKFKQNNLTLDSIAAKIILESWLRQG